MYIILSILFLAVGAMMVFSPQTWFDITQSWKSYSAAEPSDRFLVTTRFLGIVNILAGVLCIVVNLFG